MKNLLETQQEKARLYFALTVFINLAILSVIIAGIIIGIKGYVSDTKLAYESVTCCESICSKCFFTLHTLFTVLPWACIVIVFIGICIAIHKTFPPLFRNYGFIRSLPSLSMENHPKLKKVVLYAHFDNQLILLDNNKLRCAFTLGLWNPKVYLSTGICSYLTRKELLAVILHEIYHKKNKDPLKLFIVQILSALNFFLPINYYLLNLYSSASEKAADDNAINFSREPLELASALVKVSKSYNMALLHPLASSFKGHNIVEDRISRLLEPQAILPYYGRIYMYFSCLLSFFIAVTVCFTLFYKSVIPAHNIGCKTMVCHMIKCG